MRSKSSWKRSSSPASTAATSSLSSSLSSAASSSGSRYWLSVAMRTITPGFCCSPAGSEPWSGARTLAELGLHAGEVVVDDALRGQLVQLAVDVVGAGAEREVVVEGACGLELLHRTCAGAHVLGLVQRTLHRHADVGHLLAHAAGGLGDLHLRLGCRVLRLDDLLLGAELLDLGAQLRLLLDQRRLLGLQLGDLLVEPLQLGLRELLALERGACEVLAALRQGLAGLRVELHHLLLELLLLQLEALLRRDDVGDALLDVLEQLHLLLVAVLQRLRRILRPVEELVDLRLDDYGHTSAHAGHGCLLDGPGPEGKRTVTAEAQPLSGCAVAGLDRR